MVSPRGDVLLSLCTNFTNSIMLCKSRAALMAGESHSIVLIVVCVQHGWCKGIRRCCVLQKGEMQCMSKTSTVWRGSSHKVTMYDGAARPGMV